MTVLSISADRMTELQRETLVDAFLAFPGKKVMDVN